jgi:hypothetical protein
LIPGAIDGLVKAVMETGKHQRATPVNITHPERRGGDQEEKGEREREREGVVVFIVSE